MNTTRIYKSDRIGMEMVHKLLAQEGLEFDQNVEYTFAVMDGDNMAATGSFYKNTLRCLAVSSEYAGEGLMSLIVSELTAELFRRQVNHVFIYTKKDAAKKFLPLGFYEIAALQDVVFLENRRNAFNDYLNSLGESKSNVNGAIVMNANPFTLGHRYLVEYALSHCDNLHLFIVSEDISAFPRAVRETLVKKGTADLENIYYHPTEDYLVSSATFPSYFIKESSKVTSAHATLDSNVFVKIAKKLNITKRFVGEEPFSPATALYNQAMQKELPKHGIEVTVIPRKKEESIGTISASLVRKYIAEGNINGTELLLPKTSYEFLQSEEAKPIIEKLQNKA
ncbi:MAG: [citrate (pro-3S)-lyase] ligase [Eubacteriales bacterium]|nr:[citrate (pro-3S)-lyase] ligase [Eubacteriales bacterium]